MVRSLAWAAAGLAAVAAALAVSAGPRAAAAPAESTQKPAPREDNPRVQPGLVNWHGSVADARAAAARSGRPVLVFHMMGRLDRQFC